MEVVTRKKTKGTKGKKDAKAIAEPAREGMRVLLKETLKTQVSRAFVADSLGKSVRTINSLIYEGKGGFDLMLAVLIVVHELEGDRINDFFDILKGTLRKQYPVSESDRRWRSLDKMMDESEKLKWTLVMETYARLSAKID